MTHRSDGNLGCNLANIPLLDESLVANMESLFKVLANRTRLRLLHALARKPGLCVTEIAERIDMKPQAVSNQLQRLSDRGILRSSRSGTQVRYWIVDCCVPPLLNYGLCLARNPQQVPPPPPVGSSTRIGDPRDATPSRDHS